MTADTPVPVMPTEPTAPASRCENCGAVLLGEHCYSCGQPTKGLIRQFSDIIGDFLDTVLNIDARIFRTLGPLLVHPGRVSLEYFAGHRVRFVSPVRLFVFLSIATFLVARWVAPDIHAETDNKGSISLTQAATPTNAAANSAATPPSAQEDDNFDFNGKPWNASSNPVAVAWLGSTGNTWFNNLIGRAKINVERTRHDPNAFKNAVLGAMPTALFLLLPIFALLLKIAYLFKRRLYMEHLVVALHSHAFLCIGTLILICLSQLQSWIGTSSGFLHGLAGWASAAVWIWMPTYLLIMQKRIYGQGWLMTLLKFFSLGLVYVVLLSLGLAATMLATLVWM